MASGKVNDKQQRWSVSYGEGKVEVSLLEGFQHPVPADDARQLAAAVWYAVQESTKGPNEGFAPGTLHRCLVCDLVHEVPSEGL